MSIVAGWMNDFPNLSLDETGGGCTALRHPLDGGTGEGYLLLTDEHEAPTDASVLVQCGRYSDTDDSGHVELIPIAQVAAWLDKQLGFDSGDSEPELTAALLVTLDSYIKSLGVGFEHPDAHSQAHLSTLKTLLAKIAGGRA
jgi:hypothetical protein